MSQLSSPEILSICARIAQAQLTGDIGVNGSSFTGTRNGDVITLTLIYKYVEGRGGRKSVGELKINSDATRLTGTRSGGAFRKNSEWVLTRE